MEEAGDLIEIYKNKVNNLKRKKTRNKCKAYINQKIIPAHFTERYLALE